MKALLLVIVCLAAALPAAPVRAGDSGYAVRPIDDLGAAMRKKKKPRSTRETRPAKTTPPAGPSAVAEKFGIEGRNITVLGVAPVVMLDPLLRSSLAEMADKQRSELRMATLCAALPHFFGVREVTADCGAGRFAANDGTLDVTFSIDGNEKRVNVIIIGRGDVLVSKSKDYWERHHLALIESSSNLVVSLHRSNLVRNPTRPTDWRNYFFPDESANDISEYQNQLKTFIQRGGDR